MTELVEFVKNKRGTKRIVLQSAARMFDPIGFLSPFIIRVKCLFQLLWEKGLEWDEELPEELSEKWQQWSTELPDVQSIAIKRCYAPDLKDAPTKQELHMFCDSPESAYCAVAYIHTSSVEKTLQA